MTSWINKNWATPFKLISLLQKKLRAPFLDSRSFFSKDESLLSKSFGQQTQSTDVWFQRFYDGLTVVFFCIPLKKIKAKKLEVLPTIPEWHITSLDETPPPSLEDFKGQPLLILIYSTGCPGCVGRALPLSKQFLHDYPQLQIVGIHTQLDSRFYSDAQIQQVIQFHHLPYPVFRDKGHETFDLYEAGGTPHWVLVAADGTLYRSIFGSMGNAQQRLWYALSELMPEL